MPFLSVKLLPPANAKYISYALVVMVMPLLLASSAVSRNFFQSEMCDCTVSGSSVPNSFFAAERL